MPDSISLPRAGSLARVYRLFFPFCTRIFTAWILRMKTFSFVDMGIFAATLSGKN
ncbi:hypothetical protein JGC56_17455 [Salmonella enterica subsp. enterica serovar Saintpaul]|nr:hypothetical protein [Salmonella enterica subsp. enterica serovar Saintpaul]